MASLEEETLYAQTSGVHKGPRTVTGKQILAIIGSWAMLEDLLNPTDYFLERRNIMLSGWESHGDFALCPWLFKYKVWVKGVEPKMPNGRKLQWWINLHYSLWRAFPDDRCWLGCAHELAVTGYQVAEDTQSRVYTQNRWPLLTTPEYMAQAQGVYKSLPTAYHMYVSFYIVHM